VFRRHAQCPACGAEIPTDWRPRSELVAEALVAELIAEGLLLVFDGKDEVERRVATLLRSRAGTPAQVLDLLGDIDEVEEIFADALALERVLGRAMREADRRLADRTLTSPQRT
jgi:hypothetical protein